MRRGLRDAPAGTAAAIAGALVVGPLAIAGWFPAAASAVVAFTVLADRSARRPPRWRVLAIAGALTLAGELGAMAREAYPWMIGFLVIALVLALGAARLRADDDEADHEAADVDDEAEECEAPASDSSRSGGVPDSPAHREAA